MVNFFQKRKLRRKQQHQNHREKRRGNSLSLNVLPWTILLLLIGWTLWAIWHFSSSVVVPSIVNKIRPKLNSVVDDYNEKEEEDVLDDDEIFRKEMNLISGPSCQNGPSGILLLKTHKTGSSTLANILNRYADQKDLIVALPYKESRFGWPHMFDEKHVDKKLMNKRKARVFTNHARLNRVAMDNVMVPNTFYISILRDPVKQFESSFYYLEMHTLFGLKYSNNPLQEFIADPDKFMSKITKSKRSPPENYGLYRNGMFFDLGYDQLELKRVGVGKAIEMVEKEIDLFLLLEYFDESLLLLKKTMCWSLENILYFKQNQRTTKVPIDEVSVARIKKWNDADMKLYQHFNQTFWRKVQEYGPNFNEDLKELKYYLKQWAKRCDKREVVKGKDASAVRFYKVGHKAKKDDRDTCERFFRTELEYMGHFRARFMQEYYKDYQKLQRRKL